MVYGTGTRSYNRSTEARQNKLAQKEATEKRHMVVDAGSST